MALFFICYSTVLFVPFPLPLVNALGGQGLAKKRENRASKLLEERIMAPRQRLANAPHRTETAADDRLLRPAWLKYPQGERGPQAGAPLPPRARPSL